MLVLHQIDRVGRWLVVVQDELVTFHAIQLVACTDNQASVGDSGRGNDTVSQVVLGQHFVVGAVLKHHDNAVLSGHVDLSITINRQWFIIFDIIDIRINQNQSINTVSRLILFY